MRRLVATSTRRGHAPGAEWAPPPTFAVPPELDVFTERPVDLRKDADLRALRISRVELDLRARFVWQPARRVLTPRGVINLDPSPLPRPLPPPPPPQPQRTTGGAATRLIMGSLAGQLSPAEQAQARRVVSQKSGQLREAREEAQRDKKEREAAEAERRRSADAAWGGD